MKHRIKSIHLFLLILCTYLLTPHNLVGQNSETIHTIYLIGNTANLSDQSELANLLKEQISSAPQNSTLLFLGDNITDTGVPDSSSAFWEESRDKAQNLKSMIANYQGETYFIPGEEDWNQGKKDGWFRIKNQQQLLDTLFLDEGVHFLPKEACPGPEEVDLNDEITLVIVDSQWILHPWDKPKEESSCLVKSTGDLLNKIEEILKRNSHKKVLLATHHNMISAGRYGTRSFGSLQHLSHPKTKAMSKILRKLLAKYDNVIHVSGHERALQYLVSEKTPYIVSGATNSLSDIRPIEELIHAEEELGYAILRFQQDGAVDLDFWTIADTKHPVFSQTILTKKYIAPLPEKYYEQNVDFSNQTITTHASDQYDKDKTWLLGTNYRKVWEQNLSIPIFDIGKEHGGLKIIQRGGGQQTRSLRLEAQDGKQYVLRSIEKYTEKAVPEALRSTFAAEYIQDQISASHPYGAFVVPYLAEAANVYHTNPKAVYIPKDARFGIHQEDFANTICLYEERVAGDQSDVASFGFSKKIISTPKMIQKLYKDNDNHVDQQWVVKSRLFDMFIGDWDRHDDQWRWASFDDGKGKMYRPIPRDRDQAFFVSEGMIMNLGTRRWGLTKFQGFDHEFVWVPGFNFNGRYFDRDFANEPSLKDWLAAADTLRQQLTDDVIEQAIDQWPDEVRQHRGDEIVSKLKSQRNNLKKYAEEHYLFLAKTVNVEGSDKKEYFKVERLNDEQTRVRVYKKTKKDKKEKKIYDRTFLRSETKEIRLYGLNGKDEFKISGEVNKGIKVRVIGGTGKDEIKDESIVKGWSKKTWVYDTPGDNKLTLSKESKDKTSSDPRVNEYNRKEFKYNNLTPLVLLSLNDDDGLFIGGGFLYTNHGFRKEPFKSTHLMTGKFAPETEAYSFQYKGTFTELIGKWDLGLNLKALAPNYVTNYFGPGNESEYIQNASEVFGNLEDDIDYYRTRFRQLSIETLLQKRVSERSTFSFGHHWQAFQVSDDYGGEDRFILTTADQSLYDWKLYDGLVAKYEYDGRDNKYLPSHGTRANIDLRGYIGVNEEASNFTWFYGEFAYYKTIRLPAKVVFATRIGAGHNFGDYEFYQAQILDGNSNLRGYRKTRFIGDSRIFNNTELRMKLFNFNNPVVPASIGLTVFSDVGRVWVEDENSNKWHHGYGAGIWIAPLNAIVLSIDLATSKEENLLGYLNLGFRF